MTNKKHAAAVVVTGLALLLANGTALADHHGKQCQGKKWKKHQKKMVVMATSDDVTVTLPANRSTGYVWFIGRYPTHFVSVVSSTYVPPKQAMPGAPGQSVWKFKLNPAAFAVPHALSIKMIYSRPSSLHDASWQRIVIMTKKKSAS